MVKLCAEQTKQEIQFTVVLQVFKDVQEVGRFVLFMGNFNPSSQLCPINYQIYARCSCSVLMKVTYLLFRLERDAGNIICIHQRFFDIRDELLCVEIGVLSVWFCILHSDEL